MRILRLPNNPIIRPQLDERMGCNINGPSLIRMPQWAPGALGRYYLYFAHHRGNCIRLAFADSLAGPWRIHPPGVLDLGQSCCTGHLASPDVHVDHARRQIRMYYHGLDRGRPGQWTRVATSPDGLSFAARREILGLPYFRVFRWRGWHYALAMPGVLYRSRDGLSGFAQGPRLLGRNTRHSAVLVRGQTLVVFFSRIGDCPERILVSRVELVGDWRTWRAGRAKTLLAPEMDYEGAGWPLEPSQRGMAAQPARQLRDPAIYSEGKQVYLLYAVAGEQGIAIASIEW